MVTIIIANDANAPMKLLQKDNHVCGSPIIGKPHGIWRIKFNATGTNNSPIISMRYLIFHLVHMSVLYSKLLIKSESAKQTRER